MFQMAGLHELLCNNCGLEFKGFDPLRRLRRAPVKPAGLRQTDRRFPRYKVHLPATIALVERDALTWEVNYSRPARGHCQVIGQGGASVAFFGSRFSEDKLVPGGSLYLTINLPCSMIAAVVSVISCARVGAGRQGQWLMGGAFTQMSDSDATKLSEYLKKQAKVDHAAVLA
jgi:hypothetical protein